MKLVLGVGVVGAALIEYYKNENLCFYDDKAKEFTDKSGNSIAPFSNWDDISEILISPGFSPEHPMVKEAQRRNLPFDSDVAIFLRNEKESAIKIGVTGTNGKSTLCNLLKHIFEDLAEIGGNFGTSPLELPKNNIYILELSSYQLFWLPEDLLKTLDVGVITNTSLHHIAFHGSKSEYLKAKQKILLSKNTIKNTEIDPLIKYPKNSLFENRHYKLAWNIILKILKILNFDEKAAAEKLRTYTPLKYRQQILRENPLIVNDSKSTNIASMACAIENMRKPFILVSQVNNYNTDEFSVYNNTLLQKIFILSSKEIENLKMPYFIANDFEVVVKEALKYSKENQLDLLFSPGEQSFKFFKNFEHRGERFSQLVQSFFESEK